MPHPTLVDLKAAYARNENITRLLREPNGLGTNDPSAILIAYDLQAGSYVRALDDRDYHEAHGRYADAIAAVLAPLRPRSLLEPGVGEATTLRAVLSRIVLPPRVAIFGFDLSWSRIHVGRLHCEAGKVTASLFVGELEAIPLPDGAADVVYTSHAVEPNHGREAEILSELYRVTGRYLVLFEPSYELASPEARSRMESHGYCRGLRQTAERMGWKVLAHELLTVSLNPLNPTGVLVIEKQTVEGDITSRGGFACPSCRGRLSPAQGAHFCATEGLAYPTLRDIPCLARHNAVLASRFLD
jgi:hypothetical protein